MQGPGFDIWVWLTFAGLVLVLGARAWLVETGGTQGAVRRLTAAVAAVAVALVVLLGLQGGVLLTTSLLTRTDPLTGAPVGGATAP